MRRSFLAAAAAIGVVLSALVGATPANALYQDPLTSGDLVNYNHHDYRLSIAPVAGADRVTRFGHSVSALYRVRMIDPGRTRDTVVYSGTLGYSRTAYLRIKTVSADVVRGYGIRTYLAKVRRFSADYAKRQVNHVVWATLHRTQRGDVAATVVNVQAYLAAHGSLAGIVDADVIVQSDGQFGYRPATIRLIQDAHHQGSTSEYVVYGFDSVDGYQVMFDSVTGKTTSTLNPDDMALLE